MLYAPENDGLVLLLIAASPDPLVRLRSDREVRQIQEKLLATRHSRAMVVHTRWAARPADLLQAILDLRPHIVHFSGHATAAEGIMLEDATGDPAPVSGGALAELFGVLVERLRLVVLNACDTLTHAEAISRRVDVAIGMRSSIEDHAAIELASTFYQAIASGLSVGDAFELARSALAIKGLPGKEIPRLFARPGVDPSRTFLLELDAAVGGRPLAGSTAGARARDVPAGGPRDPGERRPGAAGGSPDLLGAAAVLLAAACPDEASLDALLSAAGVSPARLPVVRSAEARCECLLLELAQAQSLGGLHALADALSRLDPPKVDAAAATRRLAGAVADGAGRDSLAGLWIALSRRGDGWMLEFRAPRIGRGGTVASGRSTRVPVADETVVQVEVREAGVALRVQARVTSPLIGLKARVFTGLTTLSKQLVPWLDERLGPTAGEELTLLEAFMTWSDLDAA